MEHLGIPRAAPCEPRSDNEYLTMYVARQRYLALAYPTRSVLKAQMSEVKLRINDAGDQVPDELTRNYLALKRERDRVVALIEVSETYISHLDEHFPGARETHDAYCVEHLQEITEECAAFVEGATAILGE
jgi:hypothetical protein